MVGGVCVIQCPRESGIVYRGIREVCVGGLRRCAGDGERSWEVVHFWCFCVDG